jgi:ABC-type amino acid transport substrate-binding protein
MRVRATLCIDPEYPPLEYYEDGSGGEIVGFDADAGRALAEHWGVEVKFEVTAFDGLMPGLQSRRCDMILGGLYMSEERMEVADAAPIMNAGPAVLAAPENASDFSSPTDLCGRTVAAQAASSNAARIAALEEECTADGKDAPRLTEYPKTAETVLAVLNGKARRWSKRMSQPPTWPPRTKESLRSPTAFSRQIPSSASSAARGMRSRRRSPTG